MSSDFNDSTEKLGAHEVAAWLRRHPAFLQQFPDLALTLVVPRDNGPTASLASYQLEILREKNRELTRRLHELFANAQESERLAVRAHQFTLALMRQADAAGVWRAAAASLREDFQGDLVRVIALAPVDGLVDDDWFRVLPGDTPELAGFGDLLHAGDPVCGRLHPDKNAVLYGARADDVQSSALLLLPEGGVVAVGSFDPNRFVPGMGTLFLRMMGQSLQAALARFG